MNVCKQDRASAVPPTRRGLFINSLETHPTWSAGPSNGSAKFHVELPCLRIKVLNALQKKICKSLLGESKVWILENPHETSWFLSPKSSKKKSISLKKPNSPFHLKVLVVINNECHRAPAHERQMAFILVL
ncbi:hypothetical protein AVEN_258201-1 [Araneus ventricosus]|uniref:Uncharacterized protein n=1 Tax=Araneus ventricosus TaxID=182803 RepID=A0A4Y2T4R5_ARAVE|nr:hypothetical protein AVEN_258201-1 [Araneus ventricosus]